jgi:hypothetical protein
VLYQQSIVAINSFTAREIDEQVRAVCNIMESFLQKYDAACGISLFFDSLAEIPFAHQQSALAIKYSHLLRGRDKITESCCPREHYPHTIFSAPLFSRPARESRSAQIFGITARLSLLQSFPSMSDEQLAIYISFSTRTHCNQYATYTGDLLKTHGTTSCTT